MKVRRLSREEFEKRLDQWTENYRKTMLRRRIPLSNQSINAYRQGMFKLWKEKRLGEHTSPDRP